MKTGTERSSVSSDGNSPTGVATLDGAVIGHALTVHEVSPPLDAPEWARWLEEIGFINGERVMLMARAMPGGDPLVVRVGQSTFALRRAEAACIRVSAYESVGSRASIRSDELATAGVAACVARAGVAA